MPVSLPVVMTPPPRRRPYATRAGWGPPRPARHERANLVANGAYAVAGEAAGSGRGRRCCRCRRVSSPSPSAASSAVDRLAQAAPVDHRVGNLRRKQADRPQRVVVARDHEVHFVGVAVGVDDADDRDLQLPRFVDRDLFLLRVDDEDRVRQAAHVADAVEVLLELPLLFLVAGDLLLRQRVVAAVGDHRFEIPQPTEAALDGREVREQAAEPALVDVVHAAALRLFGDHVLGLPLGADKQHRLALGCQRAQELFRLAKELDRLAKVDDVDAVALAEDELLHLGIPALRLVAEVHSGLQQFLHRNSGQASSNGVRPRGLQTAAN